MKKLRGMKKETKVKVEKIIEVLKDFSKDEKNKDKFITAKEISEMTGIKLCVVHDIFRKHINKMYPNNVVGVSHNGYRWVENVGSNSTCLRLFKKYLTEDNPYWIDDPDKCDCLLSTITIFLNQLLFVKYHLSLNDAYEKFGFPKEIIGDNYGWCGDDFVDIDIEKVTILTSSGNKNAYQITFKPHHSFIKEHTNEIQS